MSKKIRGSIMLHDIERLTISIIIVLFNNSVYRRDDDKLGMNNLDGARRLSDKDAYEFVRILDETG